MSGPTAEEYAEYIAYKDKTPNGDEILMADALRVIRGGLPGAELERQLEARCEDLRRLRHEVEPPEGSKQ